MRALRLATVALVLSTALLQAPAANAQIVTSGIGVCRLCGHSELDTQRYVNSFLNQLFFPQSATRRAAIATSLYLLNATFTVYGRLSPDSQFNSVTISITAEVKNAIPTGKYRVTVTTPSGTTSTKTYAIGAERFSVRHPYVAGALENDRTNRRVPGGNGGGGPGSVGRSGPPTGGSPGASPRGGRSAKCSRSRVTHRGNETTVYCSWD